MCTFASEKRKDMKTYQQLWQMLTPLYDAGEAQAVVRTVLDVRYGMTLTDIVCGRVDDLPAEEGAMLDRLIGRLQQGEPVQYVLGQADFAGRVFCVEPGVLIPRPETAELCAWIVEDSRRREQTQTTPMRETAVLDLCTGSGCIAVTLALDVEHAEVTGWDISDDALRIARKNVETLGAGNVSIAHEDALALPDNHERWDIIVSNPPYICEKEKTGMERNVLEHEPGIALFVPDEDPLRFYRAIARYAVKALKPGGALYFEINPIYEEEMRAMLDAFHFADVETKKDAFEKQRMMKAMKKSSKISCI